MEEIWQVSIGAVRIKIILLFWVVNFATQTRFQDLDLISLDYGSNLSSERKIELKEVPVIPWYQMILFFFLPPLWNRQKHLGFLLVCPIWVNEPGLFFSFFPLAALNSLIRQDMTFIVSMGNPGEWGALNSKYSLNEQGLRTGIDPGMTLTPFPSSIGWDKIWTHDLLIMSLGKSIQG